MTRPLGSKNAKGSLVHINIRMPKEVLEFYNNFPNRQDAIRAALQLYIERFRWGVNEETKWEVDNVER